MAKEKFLARRIVTEASVMFDILTDGTVRISTLTEMEEPCTIITISNKSFMGIVALVEEVLNAESS